jgi:hypothetical protein
MNGHCYKFRYVNYQYDPFPVIFFINAIKGTHPTSGNKWSLIQGVNLNYLSRNIRRQFIKEWQDSMTRHPNHFYLTWNMITHKFSRFGFEVAIRRYLLTPNSLMRKLEKVSPDKMENEILRSLHKDYSMLIQRQKTGRTR